MAIDALRSSRRRLLQGVGGGVLGGLALAAGRRPVLATQARLGADFTSPLVPAQTDAASQLMLPFEVTVRQGPSAGLDLSGLLTFTLQPSGAINDGAFTTYDGTAYGVVGQVTGRAVNLVIDPGDGTLLFGTGTAQVDLAVGVSRIGGVLVGPQPGDSGDWGGQGDSAVAPNGTLYISDSGAQVIRAQPNYPLGSVAIFAGMLNSAGYVDTAKLQSKFNTPNGLAVDAAGATLHISDTGNHVVRKISLGGGPVSTLIAQSVAEAKGATIFGCFGLCIDGSGNLYVSDNASQVIWKYSSSGVMSVLAGGINQIGKVDGTGTAARFHNPEGMKLSPDGSVINVVDNGNNLVRQVSVAKGVVTTLGSSGT